MESLSNLLSISDPVLAKVHPILAPKVIDLIVRLYDDGLAFGAFSGLRTFDEQDALRKQGRRSLYQVNLARKRAGLRLITKAENKIVTNAGAGESWHNFGLAVDLVEDGNPNRAGIQWSWARNIDYLRIGRHVEALGLSWGGYWKAFKDYPHVELTADLNLEDANTIYGYGNLFDKNLPAPIERVWAHVTNYYNEQGINV